MSLPAAKREIAALAAAVRFLTLVPMPGPAGGGELRAAARYFPLVGAAVGAAGGCAAEAALWAGFGPQLAAVFAVAAQLALTGALHEDGLADSADGLCGGRDRAARLAIMRDSAVGTYGVLALAAVLAARAGALAELAPAGALAAAMAASGAASRAAMTAAMRLLPPARGDGLAARAGRPGGAGMALALLTAAVCAAPLVGGGALALAGGAAAGAAAVGAFARRRIGGATGDVFGAAQAVSEAAALCALAACAAA